MYERLLPNVKAILSRVTQPRKVYKGTDAISEISKTTTKNYNKIIKKYPLALEAKAGFRPFDVKSSILHTLKRHSDDGGSLFKYISGDNIASIKIRDLNTNKILTYKNLNLDDPIFKEYVDKYDHKMTVNRTKIDNPLKKGTKISIFKALEAGGDSMVIDHLDKDGVKGNPLKNLAVSTQKANVAGNIKSLTEAERLVIGRGLNLSLEDDIKRYSKYSKRILTRSADPKFKVKSPTETLIDYHVGEVEKIDDFMKNRRILLEKAKANAALKTAKKGGFGEQVKKICGLAKGGRVGFALGPDSCPLIESDPKRFLNEIVKVDKGVVGKFFKTPQAVKFAKGIARSTLNLANPFSWIGGEAFYVGLEGMNSISKGMPWDEAFDDAFIFYDFETVNKNIIDTASKMNLDENSMALLKNTMNINRFDSDMGKVQSQLEMVESDPLSEIDVSSSHDRINEIQGQLDNEIQSYMSNVGELFNKDPNTLDNSEIYKGFNILSNVFRKKVLTERQDAYKDIATRADPLAGNLGNWLNTNLFNLDVWKPKHLLTTKLTPQQEKQKYLDEIGNEFIPGTKIPNPKYNPRELYLYNKHARNLTYDSPLVDEALALRTESQPVLGTGWFSNRPYASGGRAGYMGGGIAAIRKPHAIPPERQGLRSIMINGKKS